jgi:hypothetical protein
LPFKGLKIIENNSIFSFTFSPECRYIAVVKDLNMKKETTKQTIARLIQDDRDNAVIEILSIALHPITEGWIVLFTETVTYNINGKPLINNRVAFFDKEMRFKACYLAA